MSLEVHLLESIEQANQNQWNHVVENAELGSLYHRWEWLRAVEKGTDYEPRHLLATKNGNPIGILPNVVNTVGPVRRLDSIVPGFGGPLAMTDEAETVELLLKAVPHVCKGTILLSRFQTLESGYVRYHDLFKEYGYRPEVKSCRFILDLTRGWEALLADMSRTRRRAIRRGNDQEFDIVDEPLDHRTLSSFYGGHAAVMERSEIPTFSKRFFLELQRLEDRIKLFSLRVDGDHSGSILYHLDDDQSTIHYAYSGIRKEHFDRHASELLHEHAIKYGIENGYERYDFRRTKPDLRDGLFHFKEQFGGQVQPLLNWERGCPNSALNALRVGRKIRDRFSE